MWFGKHLLLQAWKEVTMWILGASRLGLYFPMHFTDENKAWVGDPSRASSFKRPLGPE